MKYLLAVICLSITLFVSACGSHTPAKDPAPAPATPVSSEASVTVDPSVPPENTPAPTAEPTPTAETPSPTPVQETPTPTPIQETPAPAPIVVSPAAQPSVSDVPQSSSNQFTGVMGTEFTIPEGFIQLDESPSIGYQYTFWNPDYEVRIVVYEIAPGYIPEGAYETDYNIAKNNPDVTYFREGQKWFVQSGYNRDGEEIFYSKESSTESGLKTFWISYPTAKRDYGDSITAEFEKSCRF